MRIKKEDLLNKAERVNRFLEKINLKPAFRYDYTAIDVYSKDGQFLDVLEAGLTKTEAYRMLYVIENVLWREKQKGG